MIACVDEFHYIKSTSNKVVPARPSCSYLGEAESAGAMPAHSFYNTLLVLPHTSVLVIFTRVLHSLYLRRIMASKVDDVTINYEEDGLLIVKELDKVILSKGAWSTVLFKYQQWEKTKEDYGPERYSIRRYRKIDDEYRQQAKFNISSKDQATKLIDALQVWIKEE